MSSGFRFWGSGFRVQGSDFRVRGSGFRVSVVAKHLEGGTCISYGARALNEGGLQVPSP